MGAAAPGAAAGSACADAAVLGACGAASAAAAEAVAVAVAVAAVAAEDARGTYLAHERKDRSRCQSPCRTSLTSCSTLTMLVQRWSSCGT